MVVEKTQPELVRTELGYYQYRPLPSDEELQKYYAERYFQEGLGSYRLTYTEEEECWYELRSWLFYTKAMEFLTDSPKTFLDVGCGEGRHMDRFHKSGHSVKGLDFSKAGIEKVNPHLLPFLVQGNIFELLNQTIADGETFDVIGLCNVIEHVKYPEQLLRDLMTIMHKESVLVIIAPNDFSCLHEHLLEKHLVSHQWWLDYPEHLSYFNKEGMSNLLTHLGFRIRGIIGENPIDLNLLNDNSNYVEDETKGRNTHMFRVRLDNFLGGIDRQELLRLYETLGSMGLGRNLVYYCSPSE